MNRDSSRVLILILGLVLLSTGNSLKGNSWQKRVDRALLQVDGVSPQGRFRSLQRAFRDPDLRKDVTKAIGIVREKGFGKGHPEFIELLWPEGTQARRDLEAINALTKQLPERSSQLQAKSSSVQGIVDIVRSTQESLRFGEDGSRTVVSSILENVQSDPKRSQRLVENFLRNEPLEVESPTFKILGKLEERAETTSTEDGKESTETKSFLTIPPLELRKYDAFRTVSIPFQTSESSSSLSKTYTLKNMGPALTEIFSYLELGDNMESTLMRMTTPFFISENKGDVSSKMFVKLPSDNEANPPDPYGSSKVEIGDFPETVVATMAFPGICTDEEIKRQKEKLIERIEKAADTEWNIKMQQISNTENDEAEEGEKRPQYFVLQYNAPGTLPWRRMNEIAIVMEEATFATDSTEDVAETDVENAQMESEVIKSDNEIKNDDDDDDDDDELVPKPEADDE